MTLPDPVEARARQKIAEVTGLRCNSKARKRLEDRARKTYRTVAEQLVDVAIGARIRRARLQAGITLERFADQTGIGPMQVASYEAGRVPVGVARLVTIARLTGRDPEWFLRSDLGDGLDTGFAMARSGWAATNPRSA